MNFPRARLLVFSKAPVAGQVKTRLEPLLGAAGAASFYSDLLEQCLHKVARNPLCPVELHCAPDTTHAFFRQCSQRYAVTLQTQSAGDLGERMANAIGHTAQRAEAVILIGADCPDLRREDLEQALQHLYDGVDVVTGPAHDGGYYLIGMRHFHPALFTSIPWGSERVHVLTRERIHALGLRHAELPRYRDIDCPDDYRAWQANGAATHK